MVMILFLTTPPFDKERYGRMRDRRMTMSIFPSRITIRRSYSQGDASGKEGQFSDSDKKTAENFGCEYMDVDDFVYKYNNR